MNTRKTLTAIAAAATLTLAACGANNTETGPTNQATTETTPQAETHGPIVDHITAALDKLNAPWGNITYKGENEEAVSTDVWELDINGRESYIHNFLDEDARKDWEQSVIWLDGISVAYDNIGISLNSGLGKNDSLELAPKLAEELGGRVTTGDTDLFRDDEEEPRGGAPQPTQPNTPAVAPSQPAAPTATCALDPIYEAGTTFYSDGTSGFTTACFDEFMTVNGTGANSTPDTSGAYIRTPEEEAEKEAGHSWWADCMAVNDADFCQSNDPWQ